MLNKGEIRKLIWEHSKGTTFNLADGILVLYLGDSTVSICTNMSAVFIEIDGNLIEKCSFIDLKEQLKQEDYTTGWGVHSVFLMEVCSLIENANHEKVNDTEYSMQAKLIAINDELQSRLSVYEMPLESQVQSAESALKYLSERIEEHKARVAELNSHRYSMEDDASILSSEIELLDRKIRRRNDQTKAAEKEKVTNESET